MLLRRESAWGLLLALSASGSFALEPEILEAETPVPTTAAALSAVAGEARTAPTASSVQPAATASLEEPAAPMVSAPLTSVRAKLPLPAAPAAAPSPESADRAALAEYYASADGRLLWTDEKGITTKGEGLVSAFAAADDWGLSAKSFAIPDLAKAAPADAEIKLSLMLLKYARHARGGRIPEPAKQLSSYLDRTPQYLEPRTVLSGATKADDAQAYLQSLHPKHPQFEKLRRRFVEARAGGEARAAEAAQLRANMEMWRWIPDDMGKLYVWVNLPEYKIRVFKEGTLIHEERVIVGLKDKQTPVFSDEMETVVFKPYWALPESIKVNDVYPSLARGGTVAKRYNLKVAYNGRIIDPSTVDWSRADIRKYEIYQPSGEGNMMGVLKFLFPNKHQTYMHDTPDKKLFEAGERTFSHGCMRVRNPLRLAEVVLAEDQGLPAEKIQDLAARGPENNSVQLGTKIPVHIAYFTVWMGDDGTPVTFKDMYGHEQRVRLALEGKFAQIARGPDHLAPVKVKQLEVFQEKRSSGEMMHGFMNNF